MRLVSMKRVLIYFYLPLVTCALAACSRDLNYIKVKLEQPIHNRVTFFDAKEGKATVDLPDDDKTTIFDTQQMKVVETRIKGGDVVYRKSKFRIALVDYNNNGKFDDSGVDKFLLEKYGCDSTILIYPRVPHLAPLQTYTQFRIDRQFFEIGHIDAKGRYLEVYPVSRSDLLQPVVFNTRLPNIKLKDEQGSQTRLSDLQKKGKPLVIILWQNRHHIWDNKVEEILNFYQQNPEAVALAAVHIPSNRRLQLKSIHNWLKGRMPIYWGEAQHPRELNCGEQYPGIVVFDAEGVWRGSNMRPAEVLRFMNGSSSEPSVRN